MMIPESSKEKTSTRSNQEKGISKTTCRRNQQQQSRLKIQNLNHHQGTEKPDEVDQAEGDTVTVAFGRFNPPTIGHEKLMKAADKVALGGPLKIYPSRTQDSKKNPLDPDMKISFMKKTVP